MAEYSKVAESDVELRERKGGGPSSRDIAGALAAEHLTLRTWIFPPGDMMAYHRHKTQEEVYHLISGGPQEIMVDGATVLVNDGDWLCLPKDTPRRIQNTTDRDARWLTIGAPPGDKIMDGIRLDPETGAEIPRT